MNLAEWLAATARRIPTAPALLTGTTVEADYAGFAARAAAIAVHLRQALGVRPGDRVGLFMSNCTGYLECLYGTWWAGAVAVPVNAKLHAKEAAWILEDAQAACVFGNGPLVAALDAQWRGGRIVAIDQAGWRAACGESGPAQPAPREATDLAWLFYTSGTTGRPKGVMLSHGNLQAMSLCYPVDFDPVSQRDAIVYAAPLSHGAGLCNFIHVRQGARHVVPASGGFDAGELLELAGTLRDVSFFAAPTMVKRLVDEARRRGSGGDGIRTVLYGGAPMYLADLLEAMEVLGPRFVQLYGQGESPMTITALPRAFHVDRSHPRWRERLASVGYAQSAVQVRITGADGAPVPPGTTGEVEVKGATVMQGYWRNPQATRDTLREGWLRTGDVGRLDEDGFLTLSDRSKDVIISGGSNIYPREVEEVLLTHPQVREVSVVGAPDPEWGEAVVACIVLREGATVTDEELDRHCTAAIARFKRPKRYLRLAELPKNSYGKVLKTVLREQLSAPRENP